MKTSVFAIALVAVLASTASAQWKPTVQPITIPDAPYNWYPAPTVVPVNLPTLKLAPVVAPVAVLVSMPKPYTRPVQAVAVLAVK